MAYTVMGTLILAFGWFGFNAGSTLAATDYRFVAIATAHDARVRGRLCPRRRLYMWAVFGKPDPTMACNGLLAGLVAITAPCAFVNPVGAVIIGAIAGVLVILGCSLRREDPQGRRPRRSRRRSRWSTAQPWGVSPLDCSPTASTARGGTGSPTRRAIGLLYGGGVNQLLAELIGVTANFLWVFPVAFVFFMITDKIVGNRTSAKAEIEGLDIHEMGVPGYSHEDAYHVQRAGEEHLATHGPGVPKSAKEMGPKVPSGKS